MRLFRPLPRPLTILRTLRTTPHPQLPKLNRLPPLPPILDSDITENYLKGSGPGGQKINKTNSAVQLLHHPTGLIVKCQKTRSRSQNRKIARKLLAERIEEVMLGEGARTNLKAAVRSRKKGSAEKKKRRKYRKLAEGRESGEGEEEGDEGTGAGEVIEHTSGSNEKEEHFKDVRGSDDLKER